ncbi:MAG: TAT-variant-translocated molybdopterin oxidoreductase [Armatimonadota bacterium]|nr:TAT-variant-translocated molybdopterin oxidoreductase [Armatimonadota bacterium]
MEDVQLKMENGRWKIEDGQPIPVDPQSSILDPQSSNFIPLAAIRPAPRRLDLETVRARLAGKRGQQYWRSLEELAETEEFQEFLQREFPRQAPRDMEPLSRREFLRLMGAGLALAGLSGCAYQPAEKIIPYVNSPEEIVPGKPLFYATAMPMNGYAIGVLAENHMGRPIKIEGNPDHPASLGRTDAFAQASVLDLYDPDRSQSIMNRGRITTWDNFLGTLSDLIEGPLDNIGVRRGGLRDKRGAGLRILTGTVTSPTLTSQLQTLLRVFPEARWHQYEPVNQDTAHEGARLAFGEDVHTIYHFDKAKRIVSLDADFLLEDPARVRYAWDFINARRVRQGTNDMSRLYVIESTLTITGAMADHRLPMQSSQIEGFARSLAAQVGVAGVAGGKSDKWVTEVAKDLQDNRGASVVVAGAGQPPIVHALAHAMNAALGNVGTTVTYTAPVTSPVDQMASLKNLARDIKAGLVSTLVIIGGNPLYNAPADLKFGDLLDPQKTAKRPLTIQLGDYFDETGQWVDWHIPQLHYLESWSDARAFDGTVSIIQPLIQPLYEASHSAHELIAAFILLGRGGITAHNIALSSYDIVRGYWQTKHPGADFDKFWQKALHDGKVPETAAKPKTVAVRANFAAAAAAPKASSGLEIVLRPDPSIWDGRFANNGWLQELPKPITKLTWDNAALMSPETARKNNISNSDVVELSANGRSLRIPAWIMPGHAENSVTVHLGYGRTQAGRIGNVKEGESGGFNAYAIRTSAAPWIVTGAQIKATGERYDLADTQQHHNVRGRDIVRTGTLQQISHGHWPGPEGEPEHKEDAGHAGGHGEGEGEHGKGKHGGGEEPNLYSEEWPSDMEGTGPGQRPDNEKVEENAGRDVNLERYGQYQWGMVVDLNACIGCNACVIACDAENNIPVVGKAMVDMNREMHWMRIDTYFEGDPFKAERVDAIFQPMFCQHCEKAPCEPVCPVEATSHSAEGINEMTYNRCIGTRYCSNNCPYKVRRFNFLQYSEQQSPVITLRHNPDVTVRSRGVMEKCTYCIQRINQARIEAEKEDRALSDGDVITACQQSCPTDALVFGNIADPKSKVSQLKAQPQNYGVLTELNTRPRTSYLPRIYNPNPALASLGPPGRERSEEPEAVPPATSGKEF